MPACSSTTTPVDFAGDAHVYDTVRSVAGKFFWFLLFNYLTLIYFTFFGKP